MIGDTASRPGYGLGISQSVSVRAASPRPIRVALIPSDTQPTITISISTGHTFHRPFLSLTPAPSRRPKKLGAFSLSPRLDRRLISQKPHAGSVTAPEGSSVFLELELFSDSSPEALFRYSTYFRAAAPFRPAERVLMVIPTTAP